MDKRPALGKGLSALIPDAAEPRFGPLEVDIDRLVPHTFQPRRMMDDGRLDDLAPSIKSNSLIHPMVVPRPGERLPIIPAECRWRRAPRAGLPPAPPGVREN